MEPLIRQDEQDRERMNRIRKNLPDLFFLFIRKPSCLASAIEYLCVLCVSVVLLVRRPLHFFKDFPAVFRPNRGQANRTRMMETSMMRAAKAAAIQTGDE